MPFTIQSPNMNLPVPTVSVEPGPQYASDVNNCLGLVDSHDHSFGKGVLITPNGLNINVDLTIQGNNLTNIRAARFSPQPTTISPIAPDVDELYVAGADLYFNDGNNNIVRITQSGGVAGSPGSISGLVSPASASYNPGTSEFIWESGADIPASMDNGPITIRNIVASSPGTTIQANPSLVSDYTLTLPVSPPASTSYVTLDSSGNIGTTTPIVSNYTVSSSSGNFSTTSSVAIPVTNMTVTITTTGNPVMIGFKSDGLGSTSGMGLQSTFNQFVRAFYKIQKNSVDIYLYDHEVLDSGLTSVFEFIPPGALNTVDDTVIGSPGTYTYTLQVAQVGSVGNVAIFNNAVMYAYEIK